ncbi:MAG: DUF559 domain-containing protein [Acidimicrobiia bacterium]
MDWEIVDDLGREQLGLVTREQMRDAAVPASTIGAWLRAGRFHRLHAGVYRVAGAPPTWEQAALAATLATRGVASHRAAARIWGLLDSDIVEVTVVRRRGPSPRGVVVHRLTDLADRWVTRRNGIAVTDPLRLLVDIGAVSPLGTVARVLDRALGRRLVTVAGARTALDAVSRRGRAGAGVLRKLLDERTDLPRPAGVLEARMASLARRSGLAPAAAEHVVRDGPRFVGRVDFAYPELRLAIEVDGFEPHTGLEVFRADRARQNDLVALGWTVLRFTWADVDRAAPVVAATIRRTRARFVSFSAGTGSLG